MCGYREGEDLGPQFQPPVATDNCLNGDVSIENFRSSFKIKDRKGLLIYT